MPNDNNTENDGFINSFEQLLMNNIYLYYT